MKNGGRGHFFFEIDKFKTSTISPDLNHFNDSISNEDLIGDACSAFKFTSAA